MIQNHPEWDGFTAAPEHSLALPRDSDERGSYDSLKEAWQKHISVAQRRAIVLHNAAMFFAVHEPELALNMLKRASKLEPKERLYTERIGMIYAYFLLPQQCVFEGAVPASPEFETFAGKARKLFARSHDWVFVAGGLTAVHCPRSGKGPPPDTETYRYLHDRLQKLWPKEDPSLVISRLPSRRSRYCNTDCRPLADDSR
jgi:hypothetical protein